MDFLSRLLKKRDQTNLTFDNQQEQVVERPDYSSRAEEAASIVTAGIEAHDFQKINKELNDLVGDIEKTQYVFSYQGKFSLKKILIWGIVFSVVFLSFLPVCIRTAIMSTNYRATAINIIVLSIADIAVNIYLVRRALNFSHFLSRYQEYAYLLQFHNLALIEDLAEYTHIQKNEVIADLSEAVRNGLIPQGHFTNHNLVFFVSDELMDRYNQDQEAYDAYFEKVLVEHQRQNSRTAETQKILDEGQEYVGKIRRYNAIIKDKEVSDKLDRMEKLVSMIFHEIDVNPSLADKLGLFLNYYLPTTEKLLNSYVDVYESGVNGIYETQMRKEIDGALDSVNDAFEKIIDDFYASREMDISSEIKVMKQMMKQDGLIEETTGSESSGI